MIAVALALYFLGAFGLAYIIGGSAISAPLRSWIGGPLDKPRPYFGLVIALLECPACFGTWTGAFFGCIRPRLFLADSWWIGILIGACTTAAVNLLLGKMAGLMPAPEDPAREQILTMMKSTADHLNPPAGRLMTADEVALSTAMHAAELERVRAKYAAGVEALSLDEEMALNYANDRASLAHTDTDEEF